MQVDLWLWSLDANVDTVANFRRLLCPKECARADRFVRQKDTAHYIAGRGRLREILGTQMAHDPASLTFNYGPQGKPRIADGPFFNLSHSGGLAALAICDSTEIGIDIENCRPVEQAVATRFFSAQENEALASLPPTQWLEGFYRCWTRKEAVIKAVGQGLSMPLDSFDVTLLPDTPARLLRIDGEDADAWQLAHFDPAPEFMGAIAQRTHGKPLTLNWRERP